MNPLCRLPLLLLAAFAACTEAGPGLAVPVVTTRPGGTVEVKNTGPSEWADTNGWKLVELYRVGGAEAEGAPGELVDPQSIALDAAGGLYVADEKPAVIKQYGPNGAYVRGFGREGGGPGEFQVAFLATAPGVLVVHDPSSSRTSVFDSTGNFLRSWPSSCCYWMSIMVSRDTLIYVPTPGPGSAIGEPSDTYYLRYRLDGALVDTMILHTLRPGGQQKSWVLEGGTSGSKMMMMMVVPLSPAEAWDLDPDGGAVVAWSADYRFLATRDGRDTTQVVELARSPARVPEERRKHIRDSVVENVGKRFDRKAREDAFKLSDIPYTAPYFESIQVDGRRGRWLRPDDGGNRAGARFDVFDSTGAYLGAVPVPREFGGAWRTIWGVDRVATVAEDVDGLPVVIVYGIERR